MFHQRAKVPSRFPRIASSACFLFVAASMVPGCSVYDPSASSSETGTGTGTVSAGLDTATQSSSASGLTSSAQSSSSGVSTGILEPGDGTASSSVSTASSTSSTSSTSSSSSMSSTSSSATDSSGESTGDSPGVGPCPITLIKDPLLRDLVQTSIGAKNSDFASLEVLEALPHTIPGKVKSLAGLECAKNLSSIALEEQSIEDLAPLKELKQLKRIALRYNPAPLKSLLDAVGERLGELTLLSFSLPDQSIDPAWLKKLTQVNSVSLFGPGVSEGAFTSLVTQAKIENLSLAGVGSLDDKVLRDYCAPGFKSKHPQSRCDALKKLELPSAKLRDLTWLPETGRLSTLDLRSNLIEDLTPIARAKNLTWLLVSQNSLSSIVPVKELKALELIQMNDNRELSDLTPLAKLPKLRHIQAQNCKISDLSTIQDSHSVRDLRLQKNQIVSVEPLSKIKELEAADLAENQISSIESLRVLKKLKTLGLDGNSEVNTLEPVREMMKLMDLHAARCKITDVSPLLDLVRKGALRKVVLNGNPKALCEHSSMKELLALRQDPAIGDNLVVLHDCE